jgi:hypothetical protein
LSIKKTDHRVKLVNSLLSKDLSILNLKTFR